MNIQTRLKAHLSIPIVLLALLTAPIAVLGGGTRIWEIAGFKEFDKGEPDGTQISSLGEVSLGQNARRLDLEGVGLVWSAARDKKGKIYLGTGYDGKIFRVDGNRIVEIATTGQLVVTSLTFDKKGDLYIGTLPDAIILKVASPGRLDGKKPVQAEKWATLKEGTKHVWALTFSNDGNTLYAGTGPLGQIFAIGRDKKANVYLDTEEEHILALAMSAKGELLAGTSPGARFLKVRGPGRATALADFDATEVKAITSFGDTFFAAVNSFKKPPAVPSKTNKGATKVTTTNSSKKKSSRDAGDGKLYRISAKGQVEQIWEQKKGHVISLAITKEGKLFAGLGAEGKVISVDDKRVVCTELNLDERQVMALLADDGLIFASTGDAGAAYSILPARQADAIYLTPPLETEATSNWGRLRWFAHGNLKVQSRSGNTKTPDGSWSDWSGPIKKGNLLASPSARYVQLRFSWAKDKKAILVSAELAFRPLNQRAVIIEFNTGSAFPKSKTSTKKGTPQVSKRTIAATPSDRNEKEIELSWKIDNPDDDTLRYQLWYRSVGEKLWRRITKKDEVLKKSRYKWNTDSVPEGRYQIRLLADDSPSNDPRDVFQDEHHSVPILVDNHQPVVTGLSFTKGTIKGVAKDGFSSISGLEFSVDAGPWMPLFSKDKLFDEQQEAFAFKVPSSLEPGPHAVAVRAFDRVGNMGSQEIHIHLP